MHRNTNQSVSVDDHQNKTNSNAICSSFVSSCKENNANICDEKQMRNFNKFSKQGW